MEGVRCFHRLVALRMESRLKDNECIIERKEVKNVMRGYNIPHEIHCMFLKEMEELGLITRLNQRKFRVHKIKEEKIEV